MKHCLTALLLFALPLAAQGQSTGSELAAALENPTERHPVTLSMEDALQRALRNNLGLLAKLRELEAASFRAKAALGPWVPVLTAGGSVTPSSKTRSFNDDFQRWSQDAAITANYDFGVAFATPVGTRLDIGWNGGLVDISRVWELEDDDPVALLLNDQVYKNRNGALTFGLNQSLLKGISPDLHLSALWQAELAVNSAEIQQEQEMANVIADSMKAYWDLTAARQTLLIAQDSRALAEDQREVTAARIAAGDLAPIELLRIDETAATRSSEVLDALRSVEEAEGRLRMLLGVSFDDDLAYAEIIPDMESRRALPERTRNGSLKVALSENPTLRIARSELDRRNIQWKANKHSQLPTLDLNASLGFTGAGNSDQEVAQNVFSGAFPNVQVGVRLTAPLPDVAAINQARASGADVEAALLDMQQAELEVLSGIQSALLSIRSFEKQVEVETVRIDLATRTSEASEATYAVGRNTLRDVLEAQQALKAALQAKITAEVQALKARVDLEVLRGTLLNTLGVELQ